MARGQINWRAVDTEKIRWAVNRFNAKIRRVRKAHPEIAEIQPEIIKAGELIKKLQDLDRAEFNRTLRVLDRYSRRGAEMPYTTAQGVKITIYEKKEIDNTFRAINARRRAELKKAQPSTKKGTMGVIRDMNLLPRENTVEKILPRDWDKFVKNLEYQRIREQPLGRYQKYKENYLKGIENELGRGRLYDKIQSMSAESVVNLYYQYPELQIDFVYDPIEKAEIEKRALATLEVALKKGE